MIGRSVLLLPLPIGVRGALCSHLHIKEGKQQHGLRISNTKEGIERANIEQEKAIRLLASGLSVCLAVERTLCFGERVPCHGILV